MGSRYYKAGTVSDSWISQQAVTECLLCARHRAGEGTGQTDLLISNKAPDTAGHLSSQQTGSARAPPPSAEPRRCARAALTGGGAELQGDYQNICRPTFPVELTSRFVAYGNALFSFNSFSDLVF